MKPLRSIGLLPLFLSLFLGLAQTALAADSAALHVGVAKIDITPANLTNMNSFGGNFKDVHDPIFARALVLDNGTQRAAIVSLDLVEMGDSADLRKRIESEVGIPADHIIVTSSHDHNAPRVGAVTPGGLAHPETAETKIFSGIVYDKIVAVLQQAKAALQPARFGLDTGKADLNINRDEYIPANGKWTMGYNPEGVSDKTVWVLKFETPAGQPIAVLFNYSTHSTVVIGSGRLSGDLAGAAARFVEQRYDNKVVALYTIGPAGDQNPKILGGTISATAVPRPEGPPPGSDGKAFQPPPMDSKDNEFTWNALNAYGLVLGSEVVRVANNMTGLTSAVRIGAGESTAMCPVKQGVNQLGDMKQEKVEAMPLHLSLIKLNDVAITGVSGEVVTKIWYHLKKDSPLANTFMITLANDRAGYIADDAAYDTPMFEVNGTPFSRGCAESSIVNGLVDLIKKN